jgi:phospholipid/cholesterol/gamma-HCH transport system substrate-binding protein
MAGVRLGRVEAIDFDEETFQAVVTLRIDAAYDQIPADTFANIYTAGLLGEQYVALDPGGSPDLLGDGDQIEHTQSALVLERMIGQFLFNKAQEGSE